MGMAVGNKDFFNLNFYFFIIVKFTFCTFELFLIFGCYKGWGKEIWTFSQFC